jgi:Cof subfamily protein (haloacid dehalogenase superfamily)
MGAALRRRRGRAPSLDAARVSSPIRLVLSDVDGTLVNHDKELTSQTIGAVKNLNESGILFAVTSGRPPRGLTMLIEPLTLTTPLAGFNGGLMVEPDLSIMQELNIRDDVVGPLIEMLTDHDLSVWVYQGVEWFVLDLDGPHVAHESDVCQFGPKEITSFEEVRGDIVKVVGVSDDTDAVTKANEAVNAKFGDDVSATCSQTYYLDVTHQDANKGSVVEFLANHYDLEPSQIATIGDMANDVLMFEKAGLSIAMGNASDDVKSRASHATDSNDEEGFSTAMEKYILNG